MLHQLQAKHKLPTVRREYIFLKIYIHSRKCDLRITHPGSQLNMSKWVNLLMASGLGMFELDNVPYSQIFLPVGTGIKSV